MKYYIIAGEKSGDLHAANLLNAITALDQSAAFRGIGGEKMEQAGLSVLVPSKELAFMGFWEVLTHLRTIRRHMHKCQKDLLAYAPDVLILVDFAAFNLRMAKFAKKHGLTVFYYISPKIWAWNQSRAYKIKRYVDRMFVIMHFEQAFYQKYGYTVDYVGNPLFDAIAAYTPEQDFRKNARLSDQPIIALLPGSRAQELKHILPTMLAVVPQFPNYQFVMAGVKELDDSWYEQARSLGVAVVMNRTYDLLSHAEAALVTSGTATLETALFEVPQVVCYKMSTVTFQIARLLIKVPYISLVNLIADQEIVKELIQYECTPTTVEAALKNVVFEDREKILADYRKMKAKIATEGTSKRTAKLMLKYLSSDK